MFVNIDDTFYIQKEINQKIIKDGISIAKNLDNIFISKFKNSYKKLLF